MSYLLDTVVVSEMRKRQAHPGLVRWLRGKADQSLYLSTVTIGEIERGIGQISTADPAFAEALASWLEQLIDGYEDRLLPIDVPVARRWGRLAARLGHPGIDLLIAATALEHRLTVATRNVRHFARAGVAVESPFDDA
jgi:predicted nucleic acid-binding protein